MLIRKESLGATFATTQFFFEAQSYQRLVEALAAKGSSLPIIPGILPVTNVKQLVRMSELSGTPIPTNILEKFSAIEDDQEEVQKLGIEIATELCEQLLELGVPGLHFYTMNTSSATLEIYRKLINK